MAHRTRISVVIAGVLAITLGMAVVHTAPPAAAQTTPLRTVILITPDEPVPGENVLLTGIGWPNTELQISVGEDVLAEGIVPRGLIFEEVVRLPDDLDVTLLNGLTVTDLDPDGRGRFPPVTVVLTDDPSATRAQLEADAFDRRADGPQIVIQTEVRRDPLWIAVAVGQVPVTGLLLWREVRRLRTKQRRRPAPSARSSAGDSRPEPTPEPARDPQRSGEQPGHAGNPEPTSPADESSRQTSAQADAPAPALPTEIPEFTEIPDFTEATAPEADGLSEVTSLEFTQAADGPPAGATQSLERRASTKWTDPV